MFKINLRFSIYSVFGRKYPKINWRKSIYSPDRTIFTKLRPTNLTLQTFIYSLFLLLILHLLLLLFQQPSHASHQPAAPHPSCTIPSNKQKPPSHPRWLVLHLYALLLKIRNHRPLEPQRELCARNHCLFWRKSHAASSSYSVRSIQSG